MTLLGVKTVWWRNVPIGEFFNVERDPNSIPKGGGARYFEVPDSLVPGTEALLSLSPGSKNATVRAKVIGDPLVSGELEFRPKSESSERMRIANQNRQATPEKRHPAWRADRGFPVAPDDISSRSAARDYFPEGGLRIYIVRTDDDQYFADFTTGSAPEELPGDSPMRLLYTQSGVGGWTDGGSAINSKEVEQIFRSWANGRNVLLFGPPGTGKTRVLSSLFDALENEAVGATGRILLDPEDSKTPLQRAPTPELPIPTPVKTVWTTFHQSYDYEDFIIGLRPEIEDGKPTLRPQMGILLDALYELLRRGDKDYRSVVVFIDEINRGNAARIFGELMTFLDFDYRATQADGSDNPRRLPVNLPSVRRTEGQTERLFRVDGEAVQLEWPFYFPRNVYIVGTMNSVDRAAVPIDSALARRFDRIEMLPDLKLLARHLGLDWKSISEKARILRSSSHDVSKEVRALSASETTLLLMDRINTSIAVALGSEFELGHGLFMSVCKDADKAWEQLFATWDEVIFPQLEDRFAGRPDSLMDLLKIVEQPKLLGGGTYAWQHRSSLGTESSLDVLAKVRLLTLRPEVAKESLQWLAV